MQFKFSEYFALVVLLSLFLVCAKSEKLDENEMQYVFTTVSLTKARIASHDSVTLLKKLDSVFSIYGTTKESYMRQTTEFVNLPNRAGIIFRAIADSLNVK